MYKVIYARRWADARKWRNRRGDGLSAFAGAWASIGTNFLAWIHDRPPKIHWSDHPSRSLIHKSNQGIFDIRIRFGAEFWPFPVVYARLGMDSDVIGYVEANGNMNTLKSRTRIENLARLQTPIAWNWLITWNLQCVFWPKIGGRLRWEDHSWIVS